MIRVCVAGATGWVGRNLIPAIVASPDLQLVGAVARSARGVRVSEAIAAPDLEPVLHGLRIDGSVAEAFTRPTDVLVDYTSPDAVKGNVLEAISRTISCVIGTSGLSDADYRLIDTAAGDAGAGVLAAGNFAISAVLLEHFAATAARYLSSWEVIDYADAGKSDAPSGTVRQLTNRLAQVRAPNVALPVDQTLGSPEARGLSLNGMQVHSIRLPGFVIGAEVIFGQPSERLSIRYDAGSGAEPYVAGTLLGIRAVRRLVGLTRGLDRLLGLAGQ
ncbi:MAG: 4-hydroxy-tetrahydrodipicolinate reductase [Gemmatimonadota bacterium]